MQQNFCCFCVLIFLLGCFFVVIMCSEKWLSACILLDNDLLAMFRISDALLSVNNAYFSFPVYLD